MVVSHDTKPGKGLAAVLLSAAVVSTGCNEDGQLRAVQISSGDQLIGGPSAKGKMGDYLLENDRIRVIVAGRPSYAAGMFGGGVLDIDLLAQRIAQTADGIRSWNPSACEPADESRRNPEGSRVRQRRQFNQLVSQTGELSIVNDGSTARRQSSADRTPGYMFDMLKFLNRNF